MLKIIKKRNRLPVIKDCMKCEKLHDCIEKIEVPPLAAIYAMIPPYIQGCEGK